MKIGIDSHCHIERMEDMGSVAQEVRNRMRAAVCSVPDPKDVGKIIELRKNFSDCIFLCAGFHPEIVAQYTSGQVDEYIDYLKSVQLELVGIGEIGVDYHHVKGDTRKRCEDIFRQFIGLSKEMNLPAVIHTRNAQGEIRNAVDDALKILEKSDARRVMMHCFSGNESQMKRALELGYMISFATIIAKSDKHKRLAKSCPLESMLLETDSPWLNPDSPRGSHELTNRPWKIERSAHIIGEIKGISPEEVLKMTEKNAIEFFGLDL